MERENESESKAQASNSILEKADIILVNRVFKACLRGDALLVRFFFCFGGKLFYFVFSKHV